jgi:hypothetical protein
LDGAAGPVFFLGAAVFLAGTAFLADAFAVFFLPVAALEGVFFFTVFVAFSGFAALFFAIKICLQRCQQIKAQNRLNDGPKVF